jgi:hypothetical protein
MSILEASSCLLLEISDILWRYIFLFLLARLAVVKDTALKLEAGGSLQDRLHPFLLGECILLSKWRGEWVKVDLVQSLIDRDPAIAGIGISRKLLGRRFDCLHPSVFFENSLNISGVFSSLILANIPDFPSCTFQSL